MQIQFDAKWKVQYRDKNGNWRDISPEKLKNGNQFIVINGRGVVKVFGTKAENRAIGNAFYDEDGFVSINIKD